MNNPIMKLIKDERGASMTEYALLLALILIIAAGAFRSLGTKVKNSAMSAGTHF